MRIVPQDEKVKIEVFVYAGDEKIRHTSKMRGEWGFDFKCSCGFETKTGGAIYSYIRNEIKEHKLYSHNYTYQVKEAN